MTKYLTGFTNYDTHKEAELACEKLRPEVALFDSLHVNLMKDGSATINYLRDKPMYEGQTPYFK